MTYVYSDGTLSNTPPLYKRIIGFVFGIFTFIICFFKSLVGLETSNQSSNSNAGGVFRGGSWGSGSNGGGGNNSFGNRRPNIKTMRDINPPRIKGLGGCPGGGCGM